MTEDEPSSTDDAPFTALVGASGPPTAQGHPSPLEPVRWLRNSASGHCSSHTPWPMEPSVVATSAITGPSACTSATTGRWQLPAGSGAMRSDWVRAATLCIATCLTCGPACAYLAVGMDECRWYTDCDPGALHPTLGFDRFRTGPVTARARLAWAEASHGISPMIGDGHGAASGAHIPLLDGRHGSDGLRHGRIGHGPVGAGDAMAASPPPPRIQQRPRPTRADDARQAARSQRLYRCVRPSRMAGELSASSICMQSDTRSLAMRFYIGRGRVRARRRHVYAFYMSVHRAPCAVMALVLSLRRIYGPSAPIYVQTDNANHGGLNFSRLCAVYGCEWTWAAEAAGNPRAYESSYDAVAASRGIIFLRRLLVAMARCDCQFLVTVEDDTCARIAAVRPPSSGDVGGLPGPAFSERFVAYAEMRANRSLPRPSVWGCAGACYYRTAAFLGRAHAFTPTLAEAAFRHDAWAIGYMDSVGPALAMLVGLRVVPWSAVSQTHMEGIGYMARVPVSERAFDHKCAEALAVRDHLHGDARTQPPPARPLANAHTKTSDGPRSLFHQQCSHAAAAGGGTQAVVPTNNRVGLLHGLLWEDMRQPR